MSDLNFQMHLGFETASKRMLKIMNKTKSPREYLENFSYKFDLLNEMEVPYVLQLLFNHPGESKKSIRETLEFVTMMFDRQKKISGYVSSNDFIFFPGNYIYEKEKKYSKLYGTKIQNKNWWKSQNNQSILSRSVLASKDFIGSYGAEKYWRPTIQNIDRMCVCKKAPSVRHF
jgi:radical SAM superfamily enzyme YgiQ (UPF0313 family)